jgi:hypothetical protein
MTKQFLNNSLIHLISSDSIVNGIVRFFLFTASFFFVLLTLIEYYVNFFA